MTQYMSIVRTLPGVDSAAQVKRRGRFGPIGEYFDDMRKEGAVIVIQLGGSPLPGAEGAYSVVVSNGQLARDHLSTAADTLFGALLRAIDGYARKCWGFDDALVRELLGSLTTSTTVIMDDIDTCLPYLEKMKDEGASVLLKFDGQRGPGDNGPFTAAVRGGLLKDDFVRIDSESLHEAAAYIVVEYARTGWHLSV